MNSAKSDKLKKDRRHITELIHTLIRHLKRR